MDQLEQNNLVELVTRQVLAALEERGGASLPQDSGLDRVLVVGRPAEEVPEHLRRGAVLLGLEDYRTGQNILRYRRVIIGRLNLTQLADIAQGRIGDEVSCAVLHALLQGVETLMLEDALTFRRFAGRGSTALYQLLEGYARTLQVFGVKPAVQPPSPVLPEARPPKYRAEPVTVPAGSARPSAGRLVTEARAMELVKQGGPVCLPDNAIVTPAARDVFAQAGVTPERGGLP